MAADGGDARRLTWSAGRDAHPAYLPSGRRIVFQSPRDYATAGEVDVYTMDANSDRQRRLFAHRGFDGVPVPSPDGRQIAFQRGTLDSTGNNFHWELLLTDTLGRNERTLTANRWSSQVPSWTSGGTELVFYANPDGRDQLFLMNLATRAVRPLHESRANDTAPSASARRSVGRVQLRSRWARRPLRARDRVRQRHTLDDRARGA
jgi:Tol biopolymer transport system component